MDAIDVMICSLLMLHFRRLFFNGDMYLLHFITWMGCDQSFSKRDL